MKILIADDQAEVRSALIVLLGHENEHYVFDEAEEISILFQKAEYTHPNMVLLDWELSNQPMAGTIPLLRQLVPGVRIIALSGRPEAAKAAIDAGVDAFVSKGENSDRLLDVINAMKN